MNLAAVVLRSLASGKLDLKLRSATSPEPGWTKTSTMNDALEHRNDRKRRFAWCSP